MSNLRFRVALGLGVSLGLVSCQSADTRKCHELMASAQGIVNGVDGKNLSSVETSLGAVELALAACDKAGRTGEHDELTRAKNQLSAQADYLKKKASQPSQKKQTPDELASLVKNGDPDCPKGQAYRPKDANQEVHCTGAQVVDFSLAHAESYFGARGYKITKTDAPKTLKAEYGGELIVFTYDVSEDAAKCVTLYPPPGMSWQESTSRATGVQPARLKASGTVRTSRGELPLQVEDSEKAVIVRIGNCTK